MSRAPGSTTLPLISLSMLDYKVVYLFLHLPFLKDSGYFINVWGKESEGMREAENWTQMMKATIQNPSEISCGLSLVKSSKQNNAALLVMPPTPEPTTWVTTALYMLGYVSHTGGHNTAESTRCICQKYQLYSTHSFHRYLLKICCMLGTKVSNPKQNLKVNTNVLWRRNVKLAYFCHYHKKAFVKCQA